MRALDGDASRTVVEAGSASPVVAHPDEVLHDAVARMLRHDVGRLPVVSRSEPRRLLGYLGRGSLLAARARFHEDEQVRESSWRRPPAAVSGTPNR